MDKLHVINNSLSNIREILGEGCTHIQELPNVVQFLKDDAIKNGHTTSFIFSTQSSPNQPSGSSLDTTTGLVTDLESGWYQTNNIESKSQNQVWMSFAIFDSLGNRTTEWATPINIKGARGERGLPGEKGEVGETGPKGDKGDSKSFRTVSVYTTTDTLDSPSKPIGGKWDILTNEVILNDNNWYLNSDQVSKGTYLWMSQATFAEDGRLLNNWCSPFRLTGENGKNGVDGVRSEFIYRLLPDITSYENIRDLTKNLYSPEYEDNYVPVVNDNLNIGTVWSNHPSGISEGFPIEVCCNRTRKSSEESWSKWSSCIIWAKWGEDGIDGDGVEYIYRVTPKKIDDQDITSKYVEDYFMPNLYEAVDFEGYQEDGYYFADYGWTAEPTDVSPANPVEWVSIRKKINGVWGRFTSPKVWATFSKDGNSVLNITKRYAVNNDAKNPPKEGWEEDSTTLSTNYDTARYMWCWERIEYSQSDPTDSYYIVTIHGEPGNSTGTKAPIIYPAGVWIPGKVYSSTVDKVPYVYYLDVDVDGNPTDSTGYYVLGEELGDYQSDVTPNNDPNWNKMESFEAIYSDIGLFNQALVGKWVFHGDYMFTQMGKNSLDVEVRYDTFENPAEAISNKDFIPNICFNAVTGKGSFLGFEIDSDGLSHTTERTNFQISNAQIHGFDSDSNTGFTISPDEFDIKSDTLTFTNREIKFDTPGNHGYSVMNEDGFSTYDQDDSLRADIGFTCSGYSGGFFAPGSMQSCVFAALYAEAPKLRDEEYRYYCLQAEGTSLLHGEAVVKANSDNRWSDILKVEGGNISVEGYYRGFKPMFEKITFNENYKIHTLNPLTQMYYISISGEDLTFTLNLNDEILPGTFYELHIDTSRAQDSTINFVWPEWRGDIVFHKSITTSDYKALFRCFYDGTEWTFFEIKSA